MATITEHLPADNPPDLPLANATTVVRIRKENGGYVAYPKEVHVEPGVFANLIFVLENAPRNAQLQKMIIREESDGTGKPNPFSLPCGYRVLLLNDDNTVPANHGRYFSYKMYVQEGSEVLEVDPGIANDPPQ